MWVPEGNVGLEGELGLGELEGDGVPEVADLAGHLDTVPQERLLKRAPGLTREWNSKPGSASSQQRFCIGGGEGSVDSSASD